MNFRFHINAWNLLIVVSAMLFIAVVAAIISLLTRRGPVVPEMKSHTPECAKIEQFAATLAPVKAYHLCLQDFDSKDYTLEFQGRFITVTQQQFDEGTWQEVVRQALRGDEPKAV
jgi:hypothetical protein